MTFRRSVVAAAAVLSLATFTTATNYELPPCTDNYTPFTSKGCYTNGDTALIMRSKIDGKDLTVEKCSAVCKGNAFRYAGLTYYGVCYCGDEIAADKTTDGSCNYPCNGDKGQICGGKGTLNIWEDPTYTKTPSQVTVADYAYTGCYVDNVNNQGRAFPWPASILPAVFTPESCIAACKAQGFPIAGTEYAHECWCGNVLSRTIKTDEKDCNAPCGGDASRVCGGNNRLSVYIAKDLLSNEPCDTDNPPTSSSTSTGPTTQPTQPTSTGPSTGTSTEPTGTSTGPSTEPTGTSTKPTSTEPTSTSTGTSTEPTGTSTKPTSTEPTGTSTEPTGTSTQSTGTSTEPTGTSTEPTGTSTKPTSTEPTGTSTEPTGTSTQSTGTSTQSTGTSTEPTGTSTEPTGTSTKPTSTEPTGTSTKPTSTEPTGTSTKPTSTEPTGTSTKPTSTEPTGTSTKPTSTEPTGTSTKPTSTSTKPASTEPTGTSTKPTSTQPTGTSTGPGSSTGSSTQPTSTSTRPGTTSTRPSTSTGPTTGPTTNPGTTTKPSTSTKPTSTAPGSCTTTIVTPPTCEHQIGKWCLPPTPEWTCKEDCYSAWKQCEVTVYSCFNEAGYPDSLNCFEYAQWCKSIKSYCSRCDNSSKCNKLDCWKSLEPGHVGTSTTRTVTTACTGVPTSNPPGTTTKPTTSTKPVTSTKTTSTTQCPPQPTNVCKQPTSKDCDFGPGNPVGGVPLPIVTCNDCKDDFNVNPWKMYTAANSRNCPSYPHGRIGGVCCEACKYQYYKCVEVYANSCKNLQNQPNFHPSRSIEERSPGSGSSSSSSSSSSWPGWGNPNPGICKGWGSYSGGVSASASAYAGGSGAWARANAWAGAGWGSGNNNYNNAVFRCKAQYDECIYENQYINPVSECRSWGCN